MSYAVNRTKRPVAPSGNPLGVEPPSPDGPATLTPALLLRRIGLRTTLGRIYILQIILDNPQQCWDTSTVCRWMKQSGTEIDRGSVYRTLRACREAGVLKNVSGETLSHRTHVYMLANARRIEVRRM